MIFFVIILLCNSQCFKGLAFWEGRDSPALGISFGLGNGNFALGVKAIEKGFFLLLFCCVTVSVLKGWHFGKGEIALPWGFRLVWGMAILP